MKATGIVRNIDNLGRVVIPKEIRRTNGWEVNQPIEFFVKDNAVVLKGYTASFEKENALAALKKLEYEGSNADTVEAIRQFIKGR